MIYQTESTFTRPKENRIFFLIFHCWWLACIVSFTCIKPFSLLLILIRLVFLFHIPMSYETNQGLKNPLARRQGLVISTFGLAEIISCMPDGLVKIYIGYWQTCQYSCIYLYVICCLMSSNVLFIQPLAFCRNWEQRR